MALKAITASRVKKSLSEGALKPSDLLAQFKQTEARTRTQIRAAELLDNTVELIREMVYTHNMVQPDSHGIDQQRNNVTCRCFCTCLSNNLCFLTNSKYSTNLVLILHAKLSLC